MKRLLQLILLLASCGCCLPVSASIGFLTALSSGSNTVSITTPASGSIIIICGYNNASTTQPSLPAGYTAIASAGANTNAMRIAYKVSNGTETTVTMTNATSTGYETFSGANVGAVIGGNAAGGASSATLAYNTFTLGSTDGTSWVVGCGGHRTATNVNSAPTGMTLRTGSSTTSFAMSDTNGGVASWSTQTKGVNATSGWRTYVVELIAPCPDYLCADAYIDMNTGSVGDTITTTNLAAGTIGTNSWSLSASPLTGVLIAAQQATRKCSVTVAGTAYPTNHTSQSVSIVHATAGLKTFIDGPPTAGLRRVTIAGLITFNAPGSGSNLLYDYIVAHGGTTGQYAAFQLQAGTGSNYHVNIETNPGGTTTHSTYITIVQGTTYWISFTSDFNSGVASLYVYKYSDWSLVNSVTATQTTGENMDGYRIGNNETGNGVGTSYFDQLLIDYTRSVTPLGPGTCTGGASALMPPAVF